MALVVTVAALGASVMTSSPAEAASRCAVGTLSGPYWWAAVDATNDAWRRMVLGADKATASGIAYITYDTSTTNFHSWYLECAGYNSSDLVNMYRFRLAANTDMCLTMLSAQNGGYGVIRACGGTNQRFEQWASGTRRPYGESTSVQTYNFLLDTTEKCLDVVNGGYANGQRVQLWTCTGADNQRWY